MENTSKDEKKQPESTSMWAVTIMHHGDGYKPRDTGTDSEAPVLFKSEREANRWLRRWLLKWCHEKLDEYIYNYKPKLKEDSRIQAFNAILKSKKYDDVKKLAEELAQGEYITKTMSWSIDEVEFAEASDINIPDPFLTKKQKRKREEENKKAHEMCENEPTKVWCTSCLHTEMDHVHTGESGGYKTLCKGCGGDGGTECPYYDYTLKKPTDEEAAARQTLEARQRRARQCDENDEQPYTDDESDDDLDEKPHRRKKARVEPEAKEARESKESKEEKKAEPKPVIQVAMEAGSTVVHAQGQARITTGSGLVHTAQSEEGTRVVQVARGPGSMLVCAMGNSRIVM